VISSTLLKPTVRSMPSTAAGFGPHQLVGSPLSSASRVERGGGAADPHHVDDGFEDQEILDDRSDPLQSQQRIGHVVQHAQKEHDVERTDPIGGEVHDVDVDIFDARVEGLARQFESRLALSGAPPETMPRVVVGGDDTRRVTALGLEGEEPVPRADVQHRSTGQVFRQAKAGESFGAVVDARRHDPLSKVDRVIPAQRVDSFLELALAHRDQRLSLRGDPRSVTAHRNRGGPCPACWRAHLWRDEDPRAAVPSGSGLRLLKRGLTETLEFAAVD
jgi:hypothetical protein